MQLKQIKSFNDKMNSLIDELIPEFWDMIWLVKCLKPWVFFVQSM